MVSSNRQPNQDRAASDATLPQQEVLESMETARNAVIEGVTEFNREIVDFVTERIRQEIATQQELLRCRSLDEVSSVQTRFFQTAMDQYSAEANKLMKLGTEVFHRSLNRDA